MANKKAKEKSPVMNDPSPEINTPDPQEKMCRIKMVNLKAVCDWLNADSMPLPQNQVRGALALLLDSELID